MTIGTERRSFIQGAGLLVAGALVTPAAAQTTQPNGASKILHEIYFEGLGGGTAVSGALKDAIAKDFGSIERWREEFAAMGKAEGGGSGWVILSYLPRDKRLINQWAADHTTTRAGGRPVLVLDMYEHAYHMDYGAAAAKYVDTYMEAIRWDNAAKLFEQYSRET